MDNGDQVSKLEYLCPQDSRGGRGGNYSQSPPPMDASE